MSNFSLDCNYLQYQDRVVCFERDLLACGAPAAATSAAANWAHSCDTNGSSSLQKTTKRNGNCAVSLN